MRRNEYSAAREALIASQTEKLNKQIKRAQKKLYQIILDSFVNSLKTDDQGNIIADDNSIFLPSRLNDAYDRILDSDISRIMNSFTSNVGKLIRQNQRYFSGITPVEKEQHNSIQESVMQALGLSGAVVLGGSVLYTILTDRSVIQSVTGVVMSGLSSGTSVTALRSTLQDVILKKGGGILKNFFEETLPDPYVKLDRFIGGKYATALALNYAIYQGGIVAATRDFCRVRNNRVFSRDEIMRFGTPNDYYGGYTNKAKGEFQGKWDNYNPLTDLGGYNCRHQLDWISDELAFELRPDLDRSRLN